MSLCFDPLIAWQHFVLTALDSDAYFVFVPQAVNAKTGELLNKGKHKHGGKKLTSVNAKTGKAIKLSKLHLKPVNAKTGKAIKANKLNLKPVNSKTGKPIKPSALKLKAVDTNTGLKPTRVPAIEKDAITAHPNMAKYQLWQESKLAAEGFDVRFSVKGKNDAHIVFMCNKQERNSEAYEVVLGMRFLFLLFVR